MLSASSNGEGGRWLGSGEPSTVSAFRQAGDGDRDNSRNGQRRSPPGHVGQHHEAGRIEEARMKMEYTVLIERAPGNHAAYVPDLPGCTATGATRDKTAREVATAIVLHIESHREHGELIPAPQCTIAVVQVAACDLLFPSQWPTWAGTRLLSDQVKQIRHWSLIRMLRWPRCRLLSASERLRIPAGLTMVRRWRWLRDWP